MQLRRREYGASKVGAIVGIIVLICAIIFAAKFLPARIHVYAVKDFAELQVREMATGRRKPKDALQQVIQKAKNEGIKLTEDNVTIDQDARSYFIELDYIYTIDFILYQHDWHVKQKVEGVKVSV